MIRLLSEELFGTDLTLEEFPRVRSLRGLGTSDAPSYADRLAHRLDYRNTFFDRAPRFDIMNPTGDESCRYDFLLSSEVMEHVAPPVETAFRNVCRMLKPAGVFVFTVPYRLEGNTVERFATLHDFGFAQVSGRIVMINRSPQGEYRVFDDLVFHGGSGATLEMREFSQPGLRCALAAAGFTSVRFDGEDHPEFGILWRDAWSLPIAARKGDFALGPDAARDLAENYRDARRQVDRWMRLPPVRIARTLRRWALHLGKI